MEPVTSEVTPGTPGNEYNIKSVHFDNETFFIRDEPQLKFKSDELFPVTTLSGAYVDGIQYYDLKKVKYISSSGLADLIDLLKSLLKQGVEVRFINAGNSIKEKIAVMGLDHILICI